MALVAPPAEWRYPLPTDTVVIGFQDVTFDTVRSMDRDLVKVLIPVDGSVTTYNADGSMGGHALHGLAVADSNSDVLGVIVGVWTTREERRDYIRQHSQAWFRVPLGS